MGRSRRGFTGIRLVLSASQHLWPLSVSLPLFSADVNNNRSGTERTQVSTIVLLWMDLREGGQGSQGHLCHLSHHPHYLFTLTLPFIGFHLSPPFWQPLSLSPFVIIAPCFVKTFQRSCTGLLFRKINILFWINQPTQLHRSMAAYLKS